MYEYKTRIRYTETDANGDMTLPAIADCFQDAFHFAGEEIQRGTDYYLKKNQGWFVNYWQFDIDRYPICGERVVVGTAPYHRTGYTEHRNFYISSKSGGMIVRANSIWSLVNLSDMSLAQMPEEIKACPLEEKLGMDYQKRRIRYGSDNEAEQLGIHVVKVTELDTNEHLNNAEFIKIGLSMLPDSKKIRPSRLCVEYKRQALKGDIISINKIQDEHIILDLKDEKGRSYALLYMEDAIS